MQTMVVDDCECCTDQEPPDTGIVVPEALVDAAKALFRELSIVRGGAVAVDCASRGA